jgi:GT2 family glycosyltransferase
VTFVGAGHAIRRAAWDGYDATLFFCWEELDFCLRAIERGWRVRYRGDIVVRHKVSPEQRVMWSDTRWFHFVRNRLYIARKWSTPWPALLSRVGFYLIKGTRNGLLVPTLRAIAAAFGLQVTPRRLSPAAQCYLRANDSAHRSNSIATLWHACHDHLDVAGAKRSCSSNGRIAGLSTR